MAHTPGPWRAEKSRIIGANGDSVVNLHAAMSGEDTNADERLIAAAPDLLAALEALGPLVDIIRHREHDTVEGYAESDERLAGKMETILHAAIRKATGGA